MANKTLIAFTAGAVLGILFAPDRGSNTRKKIVTSTGDLADSIKKQFGEMVDGVKNSFSEMTEQTTDWAEDAVDNLQEKSPA